MPTCLTLETQISSVMEGLTRAAVAEICKLINSECVEMRLEIRRGRKEIEALKGKIRDLKREAQDPSVNAVSLIGAQENRLDEGIFPLRLIREDLHQSGSWCFYML